MEDTMVAPISHDEEICRFMADDYASKIMSATYGKPLSIQQISEICEIPIAVAYRRVSKMANIGLLACVGEEVVYRGKKERYYTCAVDSLRYSFEKGSFSCKMSPMANLDDLAKMMNVGDDGPDG
jgi:hypothetical protein